jgi:aflatoxin B1 aldehyde reductase
MTFGKEGTGGARIHDKETAKAILDEFQAHGHSEVDSARVYAAGTCEEMLGDLDWRGRKLDVQTKLAPRAASGALPEIKHTPEGVRKHLQASFDALKTDKVSLWYLHVPDHTVPYEVTFKAVDELHKVRPSPVILQLR